MRTRHVVVLLGGVVLAGLLVGAGREAPGDMEVTAHPGLLMSPGVAAADLRVYGVKLGDPVEKIPGNVGVTLQRSEHLQDAVYAGRNVSYYAYEGRIYRIRVVGEITEGLPPYDATRLQMRLGPADDIVELDKDVTSLAYFSRHAQFTCRGPRTIAAVDLYEP